MDKYTWHYSIPTPFYYIMIMRAALIYEPLSFLDEIMDGPMCVVTFHVHFVTIVDSAIFVH